MIVCNFFTGKNGSEDDNKESEDDESEDDDSEDDEDEDEESESEDDEDDDNDDDDEYKDEIGDGDCVKALKKKLRSRRRKSNVHIKESDKDNEDFETGRNYLISTFFK
jgi:hypothetical protein